MFNGGWTRNFKKAFFLVELMVTIAIVGILATVAVPAYKSYRARAMVATILDKLEHFKRLQINYYIQNGTFATAEALGLGTGFVVSNPTSVSPYAHQINLNSYPVCSNPTAEVAVRFKSAPLGYSGVDGSIFLEFLVTAFPDGMIRTSCYWRDNSGMTQEDANTYFPESCQRPASVAFEC